MFLVFFSINAYFLGFCSVFAIFFRVSALKGVSNIEFYSLVGSES